MAQKKLPHSDRCLLRWVSLLKKLYIYMQMHVSHDAGSVTT